MPLLDLCPCGSTKTYAQCCKLYHDGLINPPTAEALMRSRYSAYVFKLREYLLRTWHESSRPKFLDFNKSLKWLYLEIISSEAGLESDTEGYVEFKAHYREAKKKAYLHEKSLFRKIEGKWLYL